MSFGQDKGANKVDHTLETAQANIAREQYDDYLKRFVPSENEINDAVLEDVDKTHTEAKYEDVWVDDPAARAAHEAAQAGKAKGKKKSRFGIIKKSPISHVLGPAAAVRHEQRKNGLAKFGNQKAAAGGETQQFGHFARQLVDAGGKETKAYQMITGAGETSDAAFDRAEDAMDLQRSRTGFNNQSADATAVGQRRLGLARALANVNAQNSTRTYLKDRQLSLAGKQIATGRNISSTATGGVAAAAQAEAAENARKRAANANEDASTQQAVGTGIGLVAAFLSTEAAKQNIRPVDPEELLALIAQIAPVRFEYKPEIGIDGGFIGMIAEQVPDDFATEDRSKVNGYNLVGALVGAVQALSARVQSLERSLATYK